MRRLAHGSRADVALALLTNLAARRREVPTSSRPAAGPRQLSFFEFFVQPGGLDEQALAVAEAGLAAAESPPARRGARLLWAYELLFWDILADAL